MIYKYIYKYSRHILTYTSENSKSNFTLFSFSRSFPTTGKYCKITVGVDPAKRDWVGPPWLLDYDNDKDKDRHMSKDKYKYHEITCCTWRKRFYGPLWTKRHFGMLKGLVIQFLLIVKKNFNPRKILKGCKKLTPSEFFLVNFILQKC